MNLVTRCLEQGWRRIAFIGISKHAGKTTAMNCFIEQAAAQNKRIGVCSVGLDGERFDTLSGVPKPAIRVPAGTYAVSAEKTLEKSEAELEWLLQLPIESPLGSLVAVRVLREGTVMLAGARQRHHLSMVIPCLERLGVDFCLIDGAFSRMAQATPNLVDAVVIAVGAAAGKTVAEVVHAARPYIAKFQLPVASDAVKERFLEAHELKRTAVLVGEQVLLQGPGEYHRSSITLPDDADALYLHGAVTDGLANLLIRQSRPMIVVADHPAQVLTSQGALERIFRLGHQLMVWTSVPLLAIAANPYSVFGQDLSAFELQSALRKIAGNTPVFDAKDCGVREG